MATAKSDTSLKKDSSGFSWADWTIVDPDIPKLHHKATADIDDSWIVIEPTPTEEYGGLKKSTFAVEAWHWAFGWLKQKDKTKKKEKKKNERRNAKGRDGKLQTITPVLEGKISTMVGNIIERALEEVMEENNLRNEEIFQKMINDVIETAWIEIWDEEAKIAEEAADNTDACSNIFDQMLNDTLEYACDEVSAEERLGRFSSMLAHDMVKKSGAIEEIEESLDTATGISKENSGTIDKTVEDALDRLANGLRRTETETVRKTETVLERHEKTMEKVDVFYDGKVEDDRLRDGDLINKARQYVQDIIVVSLGILEEEQRTLKELPSKDEEKDAPKVHEAEHTSERTCFYKNTLSSGGGGDSPNSIPINDLNEASFSLAATNIAKRVGDDNALEEGFTLSQEEGQYAKPAPAELPIGHSLQDGENKHDIDEAVTENYKADDEVSAIKVESQDIGIYFEATKTESNKEIMESNIKKLETENVGRLRRFRNRLSRFCFWRKDHKKS